MSAKDDFIAQYYPEYDPKGGVTTSKTSGGMTFSHKKMTPETNPWAFINPGQVDVNGKIYDSAPVNQGNRITAGRQASPQEIAASTAANNYFKNGGKGLDPRLMAGMTRNDFKSNQFRNQNGTYNQQHAIIDQNRLAQGLDPWTEIRSSFQGKDQQGNPVNYQNQNSIWGNRGPGGGFGNFTQGLYGNQGAGALSQALRNPPAGGGTQPPPAGTPPPGNNQTPGGGGLPGNGTLPGAGQQVGLPPGHDQFGGGGNKVPPSVPQWWQQMMARRPGQT